IATMEIHLPHQLYNEIMGTVSHYVDVERVILFGSRARGDHDGRSDVDLAVVAPDLSHANWLELSMTLEDDLNSLLFFDVVNLDKLPEALKDRIAGEGKILYER